MQNKKIKNIDFFWREDSPEAKKWKAKLEAWLKRSYPEVTVKHARPQAVIVLGGDGTILDAALKSRNRSLVLGLNLGHVGFLATVRKPENFLKGLRNFLEGKYLVTERMMMKAKVIRKGNTVFSGNALNDVIVQNPLGMVGVEVAIEDHPIQYIRGTGILAATSTGSTAFNLSAHGPIVMPDIKCLILTELLDHNLPTPSVVIKKDREIFLRVAEFRQRGLLSLSKTKEPIDVILQVDGETIFPLEKGDTVKISQSPRLVRFVELEKHYFFKSLQEKFSFK